MKIKPQKNSYIGYWVFSKIIVLIGYLIFGGKVINNSVIPKQGKAILAGTHRGNCDPYLLISASKRPLHFIAKKELFSNIITKWFFTTMHLIPVDRENKNPEAKIIATNLLNEGKIISIFPEGTHRKDKEMLPFKLGAVDFAKKTNSPIIPFIIVGEYKFRSNPKLIFGDPLYLNDLDIITANKKLEEKIHQMIMLEKSK